jgi:hypothetical protein
MKKSEDRSAHRDEGAAVELSEELEDLFYDAIESFPEDQREAAHEWFAHASAALEIIKKLQNGQMP